jgi:hypothetical protein
MQNGTATDLAGFGNIRNVVGASGGPPGSYNIPVGNGGLHLRRMKHRWIVPVKPGATAGNGPMPLGCREADHGIRHCRNGFQPVRSGRGGVQKLSRPAGTPRGGRMPIRTPGVVEGDRGSLFRSRALY